MGILANRQDAAKAIFNAGVALGLRTPGLYCIVKFNVGGYLQTRN
jgi:hypothetical protein